MNADGSRLTQITFNEFDDENPAWSPDAKRIVFQRDLDPVRGQTDYDIFTMKADGSNQRNRTNNPALLDIDPNWSPNGRRIAFSSDRDGDGEIQTMRPHGSDVQQLRFNDAPVDEAPNWSPDGRMIAFDSDRDRTEETLFQTEIYTMRPDGRDQVNLTNNPAFDAAPDWQPLDEDDHDDDEDEGDDD